MSSIAELQAELAAIGTLVLTETGQMEHMYAGRGQTLCGKDTDPQRQADGAFFPCLSCQRAEKGGKKVRSQRAIRAAIRATDVYA